MASNFRESLIFFEQLGIYDVVLPLLLVFTIVFAILEKTRVLGYDSIGDKKYSKKNLNSMVAFVTAVLIVGSSKLVGIINEAVSNTVLLLMMSVLFLLLVGSFMKQTDEGVFLEKGWRNLFMVIMFIGIIIIFLNAFKMPDGTSFLIYLLSSASNMFTGSTEVATSLLLVGLMIGAILFVTMGGGKKESKE